MDSLITPERRRQMDEQGFVVLENVFTRAEMEAVDAHIEGVRQRQKEELDQAHSEASDDRADKNAFNWNLAESDPFLQAFAQRPEFVDITTSLLGPDTVLYFNQAVYKMPEGTGDFPWHQDDGYTEVFPSPYITLWTAVNDATLENGCISVLPGSHKQGLVKHWSSNLGWVCHSSDDADQGVPVPVSAGTIIAFWSLTFHKSGPNTSNGPRKAYVLECTKKGLINVSTGEPFPNLIPIAIGGKPAAESAGQ